MNESEFYYLGKITRKFSFKGELILFLDTDSPSLYYDLNMAYLKINGSFIPYFISKISKYKNNSVRIRFEDVHNEDMASELINKQVFLPLKSLPKLDGNKFYYHEIKGYKVFDKTLGKIGVIYDINDQTSQHLFVIKKDNKEILIPLNDDFIIEVDRNNRIIKMNLPDGLIKLYI